jgi:hypothetical protein
MEMLDWDSVATTFVIGAAAVIGSWFLFMMTRAVWPRMWFHFNSRAEQPASDNRASQRKHVSAW